MILAASLLGGFLGRRAGTNPAAEALPPLPDTAVVSATALSDAQPRAGGSYVMVRIDSGLSRDGVKGRMLSYLDDLADCDPRSRVLLSVGRGSCTILEGQRILVRSAENPVARGYVNPGVPPLEQRKGIAVLRVSDCGHILLVQTHQPLLARLRSRLSAAQKRTLHPSVCGIASAVTTGRQSSVPHRIREAFRDSGTAHLMAVSGLHLGLVFLVVFAAVRFLWSRAGPLVRRLPAQQVAAAAAMACAWSYAAFASGRPPVLRAAVMVTAGVLARHAGRSSSVASALAMAAAVILMGQPSLVSSPSFVLSFSAVAAIFLLSPRIVDGLSKICPDRATATERPGRVRRALGVIGQWLVRAGSVSLAAGLGTAPASVWYFGTLPVTGPVANLVAVPLFGAAVLPVTAVHAVASLAVPTLGERLAPCVDLVFWPLLVLIETASRIQPVKVPPAMTLLVSSGIAVFAVLLLFRRPRMALAVSALVALIMWVPPVVTRMVRNARLDGHLSVVFLDAGQGDAAYIRTPDGRHLMVDVGPAHPGLKENGPVPRFLDAWGVDELDAVVVSHPHADHFGGLADLKDAGVPVRRLILGVAPGDPDADDGYDRLVAQHVAHGTILEPVSGCGHRPLLGLDVHVLHPCATRQGLDANDRSLVMSLCHQGVCFLFTGDVGMAVESHLVRHDRTRRTDVLKVAHHGSRNSTGRSMVSLPALRYGVISCRAGNTHGFPHTRTLRRLRDAGVNTLRLDGGGGVLMVVRNGELAVLQGPGSRQAMPAQ